LLVPFAHIHQHRPGCGLPQCKHLLDAQVQVARRWGDAQRASAPLNAPAGRSDEIAGICGTERQANGTGRLPRGQAHGLQHVAGPCLRGAAGRAAAHLQPCGIEHFLHVASGEARHRKIQGSGHTAFGGGVEHEAGKGLLQCLDQALAMLQQRGGAVERMAVFQRVEHGAECGDAGHVFGAGALPLFLPAPREQGREGRAFAHVQQAHALGRVELVARKRRVVNAPPGEFQGQLAQRLHAVHHPQRRAALQCGRNAIEVADHTGFVVRRHGADQSGAHGVFGKPGQVVATITAHGNGKDGQVHAQQLIPVRQRGRHRLVFGGAVEQQRRDLTAGVTARAQIHQRREHGGVNAFGGATGEQQFPGLHLQHTAGAGAHPVQQRAGAQPAGVDAAGVAEGLVHGLKGGGVCLEQHRGGGVGVEVDVHPDFPAVGVNGHSAGS